MKWIIAVLMLFVAIFSVSALSPSLEVDCCYDLKDSKDGLPVDPYRQESCAEFDLDDEKCVDILAGWKTTQDDWAIMSRPEYSCCNYWGREAEAIEDGITEDYIYNKCPTYNLNEEKCAAIMLGMPYDDEKDWEEKSSKFSKKDFRHGKKGFKKDYDCGYDKSDSKKSKRKGSIARKIVDKVVFVLIPLIVLIWFIRCLIKRRK